MQVESDPTRIIGDYGIEGEVWETFRSTSRARESKAPPLGSASGASASISCRRSCAARWQTLPHMPQPPHITRIKARTPIPTADLERPQKT
jgi:hypothetical protein